MAVLRPLVPPPRLLVRRSQQALLQWPARARLEACIVPRVGQVDPHHQWITLEPLGRRLYEEVDGRSRPLPPPEEPPRG